MKTNYPKTLAVAVGVVAFVAFFATFASLSRARAAEPTLSDDLALVAIGLIECYPELRADPVRNRALDKLTDMTAREPEAERVAAGEKTFAMVRQDKAHFCRSIAYGVSQVLKK